MKNKLIQLRLALQRNTPGIQHHGSHIDAMKYVNKKAFPFQNQESFKTEYQFHSLMKKDYHLASLQRLIFIDFLILECK